MPVTAITVQSTVSAGDSSSYTISDKGKEYAELFETMKFDTFLTAQQAVEYGLADDVISQR